jgi:hypothetical protein
MQSDHYTGKLNTIVVAEVTKNLTMGPSAGNSFAGYESTP